LEKYGQREGELKNKKTSFLAAIVGSLVLGGRAKREEGKKAGNLGAR